MEDATPNPNHLSPAVSPNRPRRKSGIRPPMVMADRDREDDEAPPSSPPAESSTETLLPPQQTSSAARPRRNSNSKPTHTRQRSHSSSRPTKPITVEIQASRSYNEGLTVADMEAAAVANGDGPQLQRRMSGIRQPTPVEELAQRTTPTRRKSIGAGGYDTPVTTPPIYPRKNSGIKPPTPIHADRLDPLSSASPSPNRSPLPPLARKNSGRKAQTARKLNLESNDEGGQRPHSFTDQNLDPEFVKGLQGEIIRLRTELVALKENYQTGEEKASLDTDALETDLAEAQAKCFDYEKTIKKLQQTIEDNQAAFQEQRDHEAYVVKKLEIDKEILADSVSSYKTSYTKLEKDNAALKQRVEMQDEQLSEMRSSQMRRAREWVESKKKVTAEHEKEMAELKEQLEEERRLNVEQERNLRTEISELQNLLHGAEDRLKETSNEQQKEYNSALIMYEKTRKSWDLEIDARKKAERRIESLKKELRMIKEQDESYKHRLEGTEDWEEKFWQLNDELASSRSDTLLWKEKFQDLLTTMENEDDRPAPDSAKTQQLEDQMEALQTQLSAAERRIASLDKEVASKSGLLEEAEKMLETRKMTANDSSDSDEDMPPSRTNSRSNSLKDNKDGSTPSHRLVRSPSMSTLSKRALLAQLNEIREKWVGKSLHSGKLPASGSLSSLDLRHPVTQNKSRTMEEAELQKPLSPEQITEIFTEKLQAWQEQLNIAVSAGSALYRKMIKYSMKLRSLKQANLQMRMQTERLRKDKTSLLQHAVSRESNMDAAEYDVEQLQETTKQLQRRLNRAESSTQQKVNELTETFNIQIDALKLRNEQLEAQVKSLKTKEKELEQELTEKDDDIQNLNKSIDEIETKHASELKESQTSGRKLVVPENDEDPEFSALLLQQLETLKEQIAILDTSNTESQKELTETRKLLRSAQEEKEELQNQIEDLKLEKNAAETEALTLKQDLSAAEARQMELEIAPIVTEVGDPEPVPGKGCCLVM